MHDRFSATDANFITTVAAIGSTTALERSQTPAARGSVAGILNATETEIAARTIPISRGSFFGYRA